MSPPTSPLEPIRHEVEIQVTREMMIKAWRAWFFKNEGWLGLSLAVLLIGISVCLDLRDGNLGSFSIVSLTLLAMGFCIYVGGYWVGRSRAITKLESIIEGKARYTFTEETIQAESSLGRMTLGWAALNEVRQYEDLILLGFRGSAYSTLPKAQLTPEALAFLLGRAEMNGIKTRGF
jgi:hypothetical protein